MYKKKKKRELFKEKKALVGYDILYGRKNNTDVCNFFFFFPVYWIPRRYVDYARRPRGDTTVGI